MKTPAAAGPGGRVSPAPIKPEAGGAVNHPAAKLRPIPRGRTGLGQTMNHRSDTTNLLDLPVARIVMVRPLQPDATLFEPPSAGYFPSMRRALASLLVLVMTFALVARGVAAPLMHLHPDMPAQSAPVSVAHHEHADCGEAEVGDAAAHDDRVPAHTHAGHTDDKGQLDHGKSCDSNGACCGPVVLSESAIGVFGHVALPDPSRLAVSTGVKPTDPGRPPSPSIA